MIVYLFRVFLNLACIVQVQTNSDPQVLVQLSNSYVYWTSAGLGVASISTQPIVILFPLSTIAAPYSTFISHVLIVHMSVSFDSIFIV